MEDTNPEIRALQQQLWNSLSEAEKVRRAGRMFQFVKKAAESRAPQGLSDDKRARFVFRELYGFDMPERS
jgi:hypothetical protein